ncbi:MAG: phage holin family protein [Bacilli bacterium]|nr:phage holin family protein [Bacilli bacterium]
MSDDNKQKEPVEEKKTLDELKNSKVESPEDLQKLLDSLAGSGSNNVKKIAIINRLFPNIFVNLLFYVVFILILTIACEGLFNVFEYDSLYKLIIFSLIFSVIDTLVRDLLYSKLPFVVITTFGLALLLVTFVSAIIPAYLIPGLDVRNFGIFLVYLVIVMLFKTIVTNYLSKIVRKRMFKKKK